VESRGQWGQGAGVREPAPWPPELTPLAATALASAHLRGLCFQLAASSVVFCWFTYVHQRSEHGVGLHVQLTARRRSAPMPKPCTTALQATPDSPLNKVETLVSGT
jgi:hypothetical protein